MRVEYVEKLNIPNDKSISRFQDFFGRTVRNKDGSLLNGEITLNIYPRPTIRFHNGKIDGNIYDREGYIIYRYPAISYFRHDNYYEEYWTKGYPDGFPAICDDNDDYKEYWIDKKLLKIVEKEEYYTDEKFDKQGELIELWKNDINDEYDEAYKISLELYREEEYGQITYEDIFIKKHEPPIIANDEILYNKDFNSHTEKEIDDILSLDNYLSFHDRLLEIMRIKKVRDPEVYKKIKMEERTFNKVKNAKPEDSISYNNAVMIAFGLELTFEQMVKFINFAGKGFKNHSTQDKIVREFFENRHYKIFELNDKLAKKGEKILLELKNDTINQEGNERTSSE